MKVSQPNDSAEIEADRIADRAMRMPVDTSVEIAHRGSTAVARAGSSAGEPLDANTRGFFEPRFGVDLGGVRVHTGSAAAQSARAINARAYTLGSDVVFGGGEYRPDSDSGRQLLAHELAHVGRSETVIHRKPADVAASEDLALLQDWEVESEVNSIRTWLEEHRESSPERNVATGNLERYEAEAMQRVQTERLSEEKAKHANLRLLKSKPRGTTKVDVAIEESRRALIFATDTPPENDKALALLENAEKYLRPFVDDRNIRKYYPSGFSQMQVLMIAGGGVDALHTLQALIRIGMNQSQRGRNGGLWDYHFDRLRIARDHLAILSGEEEMTIAQMPVGDKLARAITLAIETKLEKEIGERLKELITPEALAMMAAFTAAYVASQITPIGWVADILVAGLIVATVAMVGHEAVEIVQLLLKFAEKAAGARSEEDLDEAAEALAQAVSKAGVDIVVAILFHKAGKAMDLKPPGPRSPGLVEVLKTTGERLKTTITEPATSGWMVTPDGAKVWVPGEPAPSTLMMEARGSGAAPKGASGTGSGGQAPKAFGEPQPSEPLLGKELAGAAALPKTFVPPKPPILDFANGLDLLNNWLGKKVNPGDPLPDGYHWRDGEIVRSPGKREANYAPLEVREGRLEPGRPAERISNPSTMNRNYKAAVAQELQARNPSWDKARLDVEVARVIDKNSVHHLIPDNVVQDHPLAAAAKEAGYDLDRGSNLKGLPKSKGLSDPAAGDFGHWTSHPQYDKLVIGELDIVKASLEKEFGSLDKVPKERLINEMTKIENRMRKMIDEGRAPIKDGHLSVLERESSEEDEETYV